MRRSTLLALPILFVAIACKGVGPPPPYLEITTDTGRLHYADTRNMLHSSAGGFLSFKDLVTGEQVRLAEGTYSPTAVPFDVVERARNDYMYNPSRLPHKNPGRS